VTRREDPADRRLGASVVVLAGGRSSRFGAPKLDATLDGRPLLDHVLDLAGRLSDDVVVAVAPGEDQPAMPAGVRVVGDTSAFGGPLAGLASGLDIVEREIVIALAGDMPRLGTAIVEPLLIVLGSSAEVDAVVLERDGLRRPLPLVARARPVRDAARAILGSDGEHSLRALLDRLETRVIAEAHWAALDPSGIALADVDRPEDLDALR
jgi:molybdopterin-guanine dinucleotide biosynthesis protein A